MIPVFILLAIIAEIIGTLGGFGSSLFFVPIAQFFFDLKTVLGITAVFHVFSNIAKLVFFRKTINWKLTLLFGIPSVVFVIAGAWLTTVLSFRFDQIMLASFLVIFSSLMLAFPSLKVQANIRSSVTGGALAGFLAGFIGTGGAVRGLSLAAYDLEKNLFVGTSAAIDLGVDLSRAIIYVRHGYLGQEYYFLIPMLLIVSVIGSYIGKILLNKINQDSFRKIVLSLILVIGLVMWVRSAIPFLNT